MMLFLNRSKRGVEEKFNYRDIRDKRSRFPMLEKRLRYPGFKVEDKKRFNWIRRSENLHIATSDRLHFIVIDA